MIKELEKETKEKEKIYRTKKTLKRHKKSFVNNNLKKDGDGYLNREDR